MRDGWALDEASVLADARQAGAQAATIFVFLPKRGADELRRHLSDLKAATTTLATRGAPASPEGNEARAAMETTRAHAEQRAGELLDEVLTGARVWQAGGSEIVESDLQKAILTAAQHALTRLYPQFRSADHPGWAQVYSHAREGAPDALEAVGAQGEAQANPVCKAILTAVGAGATGAALRDRFERPPYGWSRDAIDGALQVLLVTGALRGHDEYGRPVAVTNLERRALGKTTFRVEATVITAAQRLRVRQLFQRLKAPVRSEELLLAAPVAFQQLYALADRAGGEAPKPQRPNTAFIDEIRLTAGNAQLLALDTRFDELVQAIETWQAVAQRIEARWPAWENFARLLAHASGRAELSPIATQANAIVEQRLLLAEPDPCPPLAAALVQHFRTALNQLAAAYDATHAAGMAQLATDPVWTQLTAEQRAELLDAQRLSATDRPDLHLEDAAGILATLDALSLANFSDRVAALPGRFAAVQLAAARRLLPAVRPRKVPPAILADAAAVESWIAQVRAELLAAVADGPISVQ